MSQAQQFTETLNGYASQFPHILSDFKQAYINASLNPDNQGYLQTYNNDKANIGVANSQLFVLKNNIQIQIDTLQASTVTSDSDIETQKTLNNTLLTQINNLKSTDSGADILNAELTEIYKTQYISNITMITGILVLVYSLSSIYRKTPQ
jgi:hypothetical protein